MQFPQSSNTSNSHKMAYSHHFIPFSVFGVSISINCLFVRAQTQFILLTLTSYHKKEKESTALLYSQLLLLFLCYLLIIHLMMHNQAFPIDCLKRISQIFIVLHYCRKCLNGRLLRLCVMEQEHYFGILIGL